jgi:hypothetical protein
LPVPRAQSASLVAGHADKPGLVLRVVRVGRCLQKRGDAVDVLAEVVERAEAIGGAGALPYGGASHDDLLVIVVVRAGVEAVTSPRLATVLSELQWLVKP